MLGNTVSLTIGGAVKTLTLIKSGDYDAEYYLREATVEYRMKVRHSKARNISSNNAVQQDRHNVEITRLTFATSTTPEYIERSYHVWQLDPGRSAVDLCAALDTWETATSNAKLTAVEAWES